MVSIDITNQDTRVFTNEKKENYSTDSTPHDELISFWIFCACIDNFAISVDLVCAQAEGFEA